MSSDKLPRKSLRQSWHGSPQPQPTGWLVAGFALVLAALLLGTFVGQIQYGTDIFMEDGPIETLQACLLAVSAAVFASAFIRSSGARSIFCVLMSFAIIFAATRELPRCGSAFTGGGICLTSSWKRGIVLAATGVALVALYARRRDWSIEVLQLSNLFWIWPCFVAAAMIAGAELAEHWVQTAIEESLELAAYCYLLAFATWVLRYTKLPLR